SPLDLAGMLLLVLALRLGSTLVLILAVEEVLARRRLRRVGVLVEREEPPLRVGRRLLDLPPSLHHAFAPEQIALVLLLDLLGRQRVLLRPRGLERLDDVRARRARRQ